MKLGIVGAGRVGSACAFAAAMRGVAREVVLVDRTRARAKAVATDIRCNEASQYGIGVVSARIAELVLCDEQAVVPIGSYSEKHGVTLSLPAVVGRGGVRETIQPDLSPEEEQLLARSAETLRKAAARVRCS